jgi:hypothetical protein
MVVVVAEAWKEDCEIRARWSMDMEMATWQASVILRAEQWIVDIHKLIAITELNAPSNFQHNVDGNVQNPCSLAESKRV